MKTQDQIIYSQVQLKRCENILVMFTKKFNNGDKTFTKERQSIILQGWEDGCYNHRKEIERLSKLV